jgi:carboxylesterase type B
MGPTSGQFPWRIRRSSKNTDKWLGIPFAQPPVGNLRFKAPVAITNPSRTVKNATQFGNACPQILADDLGAPMSEDYLVFNVRVLASEVDSISICSRYDGQ